MVSPGTALTIIFYNFRALSRTIITELDYGYIALMFAYLKKEYGVINKIIHEEGFETYQERSDCIRMRIGQYFMPNFIGNDTLNCSEFDAIIRSFSEHTVNPGIYFTSISYELIILLSIAVTNYICYKLLLKEYNEYQRLKRHFPLRSQNEEPFTNNNSQMNNFSLTSSNSLFPPNIIRDHTRSSISNPQ
ncbi:unnamed protein product [Moneuplotes crassus]|uniref:Uncharacterized protein n=1 Tax=Euplotes crassus TaxID=5936 RepID=A0AAD2D227_EUPCR|nr:unnamed protein product [Moneuplotes crassus]